MLHKGYSKVVCYYSLSRFKRETVKNRSKTSEELSRCIEETTVPGTTRCCLLKKVGTPVRPVATPPLVKIHTQERLKWAEDKMKVHFSKVLFSDESRGTFEEPDGWSKDES